MVSPEMQLMLTGHRSLLDAPLCVSSSSNSCKQHMHPLIPAQQRGQTVCCSIHHCTKHAASATHGTAVSYASMHMPSTGGHGNPWPSSTLALGAISGSMQRTPPAAADHTSADGHRRRQALEQQTAAASGSGRAAGDDDEFGQGRQQALKPGDAGFRYKYVCLSAL